MSGLILPPGVRSVHRPPEVAYRCLLCGEEFTSPSQAVWTDHVAKCAVEHAQEIQDARPSAKNAGGVFDPQSWDEDYEKWLVEVVGTRMRKERRLERKHGEW